MRDHLAMLRGLGQRLTHRVAAGLAPLLVTAACVASPAAPGLIAAPEAPPAVSQFQRHLDRVGVPYDLPATGKAILVNVPAFELIAFSNGEPVFRSRVIVGSPWNQTPLITTYTTAVRFRPTWRPTPAMVRSGEYEDRVWAPGRRNPLGLAALRLEPGLLVYLHDTNRRDLFDRENRALSHGCIRVEDWAELMAWLLEMPLEEVHRLANGRRTVDVPTPLIPVEIGYFTAFPGAAGQRVDYPDVYARGTQLGSASGSSGGPATASLDATGCAADMPTG